MSARISKSTPPTRSKSILLIGIAIFGVAVAFWVSTVGETGRPQSLQESNIPSQSDVDIGRPTESTAASQSPRLHGDEEISIFPRNAELVDAQLFNGSPNFPTPDERTFRKNFTFPDGETVSITFTTKKRFDAELSMELDNGKSPDFFSNLHTAAIAGNQQAGVKAFLEVKKCLLANHSQVTDSANDERCREVTPEMANEALGLLESIADQGSLVALEILANMGNGANSDIAKQRIESLAKAGNIWGIQRVAKRTGTSDHLTVEDQIFQETYALVSSASTAAYFDGVQETSALEIRNKMVNVAYQRIQALPPSVRDRVLEEAKEILANDYRCCHAFIAEEAYGRASRW